MLSKYLSCILVICWAIWPSTWTSEKKPECRYVDLVVFEVFQVKSFNVKCCKSVVVPVTDIMLQYLKVIINRITHVFTNCWYFQSFVVAYWWLFIWSWRMTLKNMLMLSGCVSTIMLKIPFFLISLKQSCITFPTWIIVSFNISICCNSIRERYLNTVL